MNRIEHIITGLGLGGAELMLAHLVRRGGRFRHGITTLAGTSGIARDLAADGVPVSEIGMRKNPASLWHLGRMAARLRAQQPSLVQTWLYHADLAGGLAARRAGLPVVWNLRQTEVGPRAHKLNTSMVMRLCARLSRSMPIRIVCGSNAARRAHEKMGFSAEKMLVIRNGVDTHAFRPDPGRGRALRDELGLDAGTLLIGRIGRYHPQKDYHGFVQAAAIIAQTLPEARFVLAGTGVEPANRALRAAIDAAGIAGRCHLLGARRDVAQLMAGLDLVVSSSIFGEGFPNVIAEAMACGVPCVATDVGDSAEILGRADRVVPAGDYPGLAAAALAVLRQGEDSRRAEGAAARRRVAGEFALERMIDAYESLYEQVLAARRPRGTRHGGAR